MRICTDLYELKRSSISTLLLKGSLKYLSLPKSFATRCMGDARSAVIRMQCIEKLAFHIGRKKGTLGRIKQKQNKSGRHLNSNNRPFGFKLDPSYIFASFSLLWSGAALVTNLDI